MKIILPKKIINLIKKDSFYNRNCLYVYEDRIEYNEIRKVKIDKTMTTEINILHIIPFKEGITFNHNRKDKREIKRLVFRNPSLLLDGISDIIHHYENTSNNMINNNISCNSTYITTNKGIKIAVHQYLINGRSFHTSDIVVQEDIEIFNLKETLSYFKYDDKAIIYDEIEVN